MSTMNATEAKTIKDITEGEDGSGLRTPEHNENSSVAGDSPAPKRGKVTVKVKGGQYVPREYVRRNNILSMRGLAREHAALIKLIRSGEMPLDRGEVLSRAYARHKEMVHALEQLTELGQLVAQLKALRGDPSPQLMIDEARAKVSE
jgi:hypothetical protein